MKVYLACVCALVDFWVLRLPCPVRAEARLSRYRLRRVGGAALTHKVLSGDKVGLPATEELGARLVSQLLDPCVA